MRLLSELKLPADISNLRDFVEFVSRCAEEQGVSPGRITEIGVATEEVLVNICSYAYQDQVGEVKITCLLDDESRFIIEFEDTGIPFDVHRLDAPDLTDDIAERQVGGLGVFIIKELMDEVKYRREDNKNILRLVP
ncbi:MAG: ATP-binding protein [Syntrophobacterales bacterium]|jgi:anti-sigma regulatory factor (Ser/Thr protein kinase)